MPAIVSALESAGRYTKKIGGEGHVLLRGFDGDATAFQMLAGGYLDADGVQDARFESRAAVPAVVVLSVLSIIALASITGASAMSGDGGWLASRGWAAGGGMGSMLLLGMLLGGANGLASTRLKMPSFIVTLIMRMFLSGFAIWLTKSQNIYHLPPVLPGFNLCVRRRGCAVPPTPVLASSLVIAPVLACRFSASQDHPVCRVHRHRHRRWPKVSRG